MSSPQQEPYQPFWFQPGCLGIMFVFGIMSGMRAIPDIAPLLKSGDYGGIAGEFTICVVLVGWSLFAFARNARVERSHQPTGQAKQPLQAKVADRNISSLPPTTEDVYGADTGPESRSAPKPNEGTRH